ncbi:MAG TPA: glycosyltransferase family 4 protein [Acidobacteriota bacterium]|jgi:UDP-glucose:(heptosyl)LPS alpha-1,3-glucosyltransferase
MPHVKPSNQLAVITDQWNPRAGGSEAYLADLVQEIVRRECSVRVYCRASSAAPEGFRLSTIRSLWFAKSLRERNFCRKSVRLASPQAAAAVLATRAMPGVTHCQLLGGLYGDAFEAEREAMEPSLRKIIFPAANLLNPKRRMLLALEQKTLSGPRVPRLWVNSEMIRQRLAERFGISAETISMVRHGICLRCFSPVAPSTAVEPVGSGKNSRALKLLFVAHNFLLKGLHCVFAAMREALRGGVETTLQIVGNGDVRAFYKIAADLGISSQVSFQGGTDRNALVEFYRGSDALVHPTFYDPCSSVALEALACGCPVITTQRNGASELIQNGREGFVVDHPRNTFALVRTFETLLVRERAMQMRRSAALLGQSFDLTAHVDALMEWLGLN